MSFNSERDSNTSNSNNSSNKISSLKNQIISNNNSPSSYKAFDNSHNNISYSKKMIILENDIKNNILEDYNSNINKLISQKYNSSLKTFSLSNNKINNNKSNNNLNDINSKSIQLRNSGLKKNFDDFSNAKEEREQKSIIINDNSNINNNSNQYDHKHDEQYKVKVFYEGKFIELMINKNDKFKKLILCIKKKLIPYYQIIDFDILYKLKAIDILNSFNMKIIDTIGEVAHGAVVTFLLKKKKKTEGDKKVRETSVSIRNFPSLTDLAIDLNYFLKKETRDSDFFVDCKKNICKVTFACPEKAFSLVSFLSKLKLKKPIYKRLRVNLDYKLDVVTNVNKHKLKPPKIMLPFLNKEMIYNLENKSKNYFIKDPSKSPSYSYGRKNIKLIIANNFSFSSNKKINNYNNKKIEDIFFLQHKKDKEKNKQFYTINANNPNSKNIKIMSYKNKNKNKHNNLFDKSKNSEIMSPKRVRRSSFFNPIINLKNDYKEMNQFNLKITKENNNNNETALNKRNMIKKNSDIMLRSWSNLDKLKFKSKIINKKESENKLKNEKNEKNENIHTSQPSGTIKNNNQENEKRNEENYPLNLLDLLKQAKVSDDSSESSEEKSSYDYIKNKKSSKYLFKNKNKRFMFFKGLIKRPKRKNNEYIGKKSDF